MVQDSEISNFKNPVAQDTDIFRRKTMQIVDNCLNKIAVASCVEDLMHHDGNLINSFFSRNEFEQLFSVYKTLQNMIASGQLSIRSNIRYSRRLSRMKQTSTKLHAGQIFSIDAKQEAQIMSLLTELTNNQDVLDMAHKIIQLNPKPEYHFYWVMKKFKTVMEHRINMTAAEEITYLKLIADTFVKNRKFKFRNNEMKKIHNMKMIEVTNKIEEINKLATIFELQKGTMIENSQMLLKQYIIDSEVQMASDTIANKTILTHLESESKAIKLHYFDVLQTDLKEEQKLRKKRQKVELQLATSIALYDQEVGELNEKYEILNDGYSKEKSEYDELKSKFDIQEKIHTELMTEKNHLETLKWAQKFLAFKQKRAVRIISDWWKKAFADRKAKRKAKRDGKESTEREKNIRKIMKRKE